MDMPDSDTPAAAEALADLPHLADALEGDSFRQFLDHIPFGVAVSNLQSDELIVYANPEFERITGLAAADLEGKTWAVLPADIAAEADDRMLRDGITTGEEYLGAFRTRGQDQAPRLDAWSNRILNEEGQPAFRLVALAVTQQQPGETEGLERTIQEKDTLLRELQHRVKNNLQMITALIRLEARNLQTETPDGRFDRLAGRVEALALLYRSMSEAESGETIDLGVYVSQIASAVMAAHAVAGIRLSLKVDTWPVSVNVAMPAGLVVNELLTNALKHAFVGRDSGEITLESLIDDTGCVITVADDGIGLQPGMQWPKPGKLSALIVRSLEQNVKAEVRMESAPDAGVSVRMFFAKDKAQEA